MIIYVKQAFPYPPPSAGLPSGYTAIDYIDTSRAGFLPIPITLLPSYSVVLDYQLLSIPEYTAQEKIGPYLISPTASVGYVLPTVGYKCISANFGYTSSTSSYVYLGIDWDDQARFTANTKRHTLYFQPYGALLDSASYPTSSMDGIGLCLYYLPTTPDTLVPSLRSIPAYIYSFIIYGFTEVVFYGVPCTNPDGFDGLFDLIGQTFYPYKLRNIVTVANDVISCEYSTYANITVTSKFTFNGTTHTTTLGTIKKGTTSSSTSSGGIATDFSPNQDAYYIYVGS